MHGTYRPPHERGAPATAGGRYRKLKELQPGEQAKILFPCRYGYRGFPIRRFAATGMVRGNASIVVLAPPKRSRLVLMPLFAPLHKDLNIKRGGWTAPPRKPRRVDGGAR